MQVVRGDVAAMEGPCHGKHLKQACQSNMHLLSYDYCSNRLLIRSWLHP